MSTYNLADFIRTYKDHDLNERSVAQSHFIELCLAVGVLPPLREDPSGHTTRFEQHLNFKRPLRKRTEKSVFVKEGERLSTRGFADVWKEGSYIWEYKTRGENLLKAYWQLLTYVDTEDIGNPPIRVVCDTNCFLIRTSFDGYKSKTYTLTLDEISDDLRGITISVDGLSSPLKLLYAIFHNPMFLHPIYVSNVADEQAYQKWIEWVRKTIFIAPPLPNRGLIGRDALLVSLKSSITNKAAFALFGLPGGGKTSVAQALAYDLDIRRHFSDGVLWARVGNQPDVRGVLMSWAEALDVPEAKRKELERIADPKDAVNAIHKVLKARLASMQMLLVIDDVWDIEVARAFKVGGRNCSHLLTTRNMKIALPFAGEEQIEKVDELLPEDSLALLRALAPQAIAAEEQAAKDLAAEVWYLPLALIIMGSYLALESYHKDPDRIASALTHLRNMEARMNDGVEDEGGYPSIAGPISLQASIALSDEALSDHGKQALRALSVFAPKTADFDKEAVREVVPLADYKPVYELADAGLLESSGRGRYTIHQTISDYAIMRVETESPSKISPFTLKELKERFIKYYYDPMYTDPTDEILHHIIENIDQVIKAEEWFRQLHPNADKTDLSAIWGIYREAKGLGKQPWNIYNMFVIQKVAGPLISLLSPATSANNNWSFARYFREEGKYEEALNYFRLSLSDFEKAGSIVEAVAVLGEIVELEEAMQHPELETSRARLKEMELRAAG